MVSLFELKAGLRTCLDINRMLYKAAKTGDIEMVRRLFELEPRPEVNSKHKHDQTALEAASGKNHVEIMKVLVEQGNADVAPMDIIAAVRSNSFEALKYLVKKSKDLSSHVNFIDESNENMTAVHYASLLDHTSLKFLAVLVRSGASLDAKNNKGNTVLHLKSLTDRGGHVEWFLEKGANPSIRNDNNETAWELAVRLSKFSAIKAFAYKESERQTHYPQVDRSPGPLQRDVWILVSSEPETEWHHIDGSNSVRRTLSNSYGCECTD